jgi:hypothetical protein
LSELHIEVFLTAGQLGLKIAGHRLLVLELGGERLNQLLLQFQLTEQLLGSCSHLIVLLVSHLLVEEPILCFHALHG